MRHTALLTVLAMLLLPAGTWAFASKLVPYGGPIPCAGFAGVIADYALDISTRQEAGNILETLYLAPAGQSWSTQDQADNLRLLDAVDALKADAGLLSLRLFHLLGLCISAEQNPGITQQIFLQRLGIPRP